MHLMTLWNSVQTSKEIRKYQTVVMCILLQNKESGTKTCGLCIRNYDTQLFQNNSYFELLVKQMILILVKTQDRKN